ncbi:c-type cytochrome [Hwanghaeella sp.]|uniref:c-type cytochrome n=1 Tax=Hwanghaeella sp. TaxID=2605943 RepID=UPI003CCBEDD0
MVCLHRNTGTVGALFWGVLAVFFSSLLPGAVHIARADLVAHTAPVRDITISKDGKRALTTGFDDLVILWDLASNEPRLEFVGHEAAVNAAVFLDEGRIASVGDDGTLRLWDAETAKPLATIEAHSKKAVSVAASPDGRLIATGAWDRLAKVWDATTGKEIRSFDGHRASVNVVAFTGDSKFVLSGGYGGHVWLWPVDPAGGEARLIASTGFPVNDMAVSGDGKVLVVGAADGKVRAFDLSDGSERHEYSGHEGAVLAVAVNQDGSLIASGATDGYLLLWEGGDKPKERLPVEYYRAVWSIAFTPVADQVYAAGVDSVARGWFVETGQPIGGETTPFQPIERVSTAMKDSDDIVERGSFHFRKCAVCHSLSDDGKHRAGPTLDGIFGRKVGTHPGYEYSDALTGADIVWTPETISRLFEVGPDVMLPGTKMPLQKLPKKEDRDALVEFLKAKTGNGPGQ